MSTSHKTAIVTGASKGIGVALATRLASDGFQTVVNYSSSPEAAQETVAAINSLGGRAVAIQANVADASAFKALFDQTEAVFGPVDVLVNNAGVLKMGPLAEATDEDYEWQIGINLTGTFNGMREGAKRIRDGGRIINFSTSIIGQYQPNYGIYAATKSAVEAMTHILAKELGGRRITVNAVAPGPVGTELFLKGKPDSLIEKLTNEIPLGRLGEPDDIAGVVSFLAGPDSGWVNGQVIKANGGRN